MAYPGWERPFAVTLSGSDIDLTWKQSAGPFVNRGRRDALDVWPDQAPAHGLRQESHWRIAHEHGLRLPVLLIATVGLRVGAGRAHEVVVLGVLVEADVAKACREEDRI